MCKSTADQPYEINCGVVDRIHYHSAVSPVMSESGQNHDRKPIVPEVLGC
jgi:hypothetical protein